jgi:hypothetical protein
VDGPIHLIVRLSEDGKAYATSPQAPGLAYGRQSLHELHDDLEGVLSFHFEQPGPFKVIEHHERHHDISGHELVTRIAMDEHHAARLTVSDRIGQVMAAPAQAESLLSAVPNSAGEVISVCAGPSDTIGWLTEQLDPRGDAFVAALSIADSMLLGLPFTVGDGSRPGWEAASYPRETPLSEIMQRSPVVTPSRVSRYELCR